MREPTAREIDQALEGFKAHEKFCGHLQIRDKEGVVVPYRSSPAGLKLDRAIRRLEDRTRQVNNLGQGCGTFDPAPKGAGTRVRPPRRHTCAPRCKRGVTVGYHTLEEKQDTRYGLIAYE